MIANIPATAPLWKGASQEALSSIIENLSSASYHFADDSSAEWGRAKAALLSAAEQVNELGLGYSAIRRLHTEVPQLVSFDQFMDAILLQARQP